MAKLIVGIVMIASLPVLLTLSAQPAPAGLQEFLQNQLAFTPSELSALNMGQIIVRLPRTAETREVAAFAIMRLNVTSDFFLDRMRDIVNFKKSDNVLQIGKFSGSPRIEDLENLTLDRDETDTVRRCRLSKCDFKLSGSDIDRFRKEINWSANDYPEHATVLMREVVLGSVRAYLSAGNAALGEYNDKPYKLNLAHEFRSLLEPSVYMYGYAPELHKYLSEFPNSQSAHIENFFYWSKEKFGLKPVISATHVAVYRSSRAPDSDVLIASRGIYANHYLDASLGLTAFIHRTVSNQSQTYLIYINRSKTDALRGMFAGVKRSLISGSLRAGAKKNMEMIKQTLESEYSKR
jgi:hypothetical protein